MSPQCQDCQVSLWEVSTAPTGYIRGMNSGYSTASASKMSEPFSAPTHCACVIWATVLDFVYGKIVKVLANAANIMHYLFVNSEVQLIWALLSTK